MISSKASFISWLIPFEYLNTNHTQNTKNDNDIKRNAMVITKFNKLKNSKDGFYVNDTKFKHTKNIIGKKLSFKNVIKALNLYPFA
jgi:hypothetical protein